MTEDFYTDPELLKRLIETLNDADLARVLFHIEAIAAGTGWGEVVVTLKNGRIDEIASTMREKRRSNK